MEQNKPGTGRQNTRVSLIGKESKIDDEKVKGRLLLDEKKGIREGRNGGDRGGGGCD